MVNQVGHDPSVHSHDIVKSASSQVSELDSLRTELRIAHEQVSHLTNQVTTLEGNVSDLRQALRMLEAGPTKQQSEPGPVSAEAPATDPTPSRRPGFFSRLLGRH
jgi:chromosome segregation ATPase